MPVSSLHVHLAARPRPLLVGVTRRVALPYAADLKHALEHKADRARAETDRLDRSKAGADAGLATEPTLWTTHYDFDDLEGKDAPRRRCHSTCLDAWLPWTWADEAIKFEPFMSAFTKLVLLIRETLCADEESQSVLQADTDQFVRQVSMRLRRPGNWRWMRPRALRAIDSWRQKIAEGVAWDNNSLARLEDTQHLPPDGYLRHEILEHNHDPHGENWSDVVSSALELWQEECGLQEGGKLLVMPGLGPDESKRRMLYVGVFRPHNDMRVTVCDETKMATIKRALAIVTRRNPVDFVLRQDGCRCLQDSCVAELEDWDDDDDTDPVCGAALHSGLTSSWRVIMSAVS
ncbi:hypothetical protein BMF94_3078 [Rhodotorula taiwanensis]|uniref:Uncharacterized protein n=1 Tax=Rhodotorula taiwanensis TaxID=741276 RepID=A0A2S5BAX0_9BASI|nr:hypothetical protein BMF94_3078 [Rhodotorula taiwanensis]